MADTNIAFANIVPNTTPASWSQAYNAGKLFAVLSLQKEAHEEMNNGELSVLGKEVISTFEQEFFTLENKDLDGIKNAIHKAVEKILHLPSYSFVISYISGSVLYVFIAGSGSVILKRESKIGTILEADEIGEEVKSASGFLQNEDLIVIQTKNFSKIVSIQALAQALDQEIPNKIAEELAPKIHEKQDGSACGIVLFYKDEKAVETLAAAANDVKETVSQGASLGAASSPIPPKSDNFEEISLDNLEEEEKEEKSEEKLPEEKESLAEKVEQESKTSEPPLSELVHNLDDEAEEITPIHEPRKPRMRFSIPIGGLLSRINFRGLTHRRRLLLTVAAIIVVILGVSIFFGITGRNETATKEAFAQIYPKAQELYNEGQSLKDLNANLAAENFSKAQKLLSDNKDKFKEGSSEDNQIEDLLSKVNSELGTGEETPEDQISATEADSDSAPMLAVAQNNSGVSYFTQDPKYVYFIDGAGIQRIDKESSDKTQVVAKNWTSPAGVGVFSGNLYVLDKDVDEIFKFTPPATGSAYTRSAYLSKETTPDFANASSMAIDGSIYVLTSDGKVMKFLRGASEAFNITGLSKPLSKPTKIYTIEDFTNVYILDPGNSRIVVLDKSGKFIKQYPSSVIKSARDFEISDDEGTAYILSGGKIYSVNLK